MQAIVLTRYGRPGEVLRLEEWPKPEPGVGDVLVAVKATAVNDWDWCFARGMPYAYRLLFGLTRPKVAVLGAEVAGTVEAIGPGSSRFEVGDEVYGDISEAGFGGFAEYVCVREDALESKPKAMTFSQAAAIPHAAALALQGLRDVGGLGTGERVLINGAGGGVGTIGVQIARRYGAEVTGVDAGFKLDQLTALGFDHVVDYRREDFTRSGRRYHLILDTRTNRSPLRYLHALEPEGRYVTVGGSVPRLLQIAATRALLSRATGKRLGMVALKPNRGLVSINEMFESGGLETLIDGPYPLAEVPQAVERFGAAKHVGKIVITVAS